MSILETSTPPRRGPRNVAFMQLRNYRLPPSGIVSILHRISGVLLFLALPLLVYAFDRSITSESTYQYVAALWSLPLLKIIALLLLWSFSHHLFAGMRFLVLDIHYGVEKVTARRSSLLVLGLSGLLALVWAWLIFI